METIIKPKWYFQIQEPIGGARFFIGKVGYREGRTKFLCINIGINLGLFYLDFGRGY